MTKPVVFIDMANTTYTIDKAVRISDIVNPNRPHMLDIEIMNGVEVDGGSIRVVRDSNRRSGLLIVELIDQSKTWLAPAHCTIYSALENLFNGYLAIEYVTNLVGVYRFYVILGNKEMLDSSQFQTPSTEGFASTMSGIEPVEQVHTDRQEFRAAQIREEFDKLAEQIETLESVKGRLPAVYDTDYRSGIGIAYLYNGLHFYVNLVDGETDQAAVLCTHYGESVGIFFCENVFITKQQAAKQRSIDVSMIDPADFSEMLENYSAVADATGLIAPHRRGSRGRDTGRRDQRRSHTDDNLRGRGGRGR